MPILGGCCFCFDLKAGTKIIGVLNLIGALVNTLILAVFAVILTFFGIGVDAVKELQAAAAAANNNNNNALNDDYADVLEQSEQMFDIIRAHITLVTILLYIFLALMLLLVVTSSMLIHGVNRDRRGLFMPFIVQYGVNIVFYFAMSVVIFVLFSGQSSMLSTGISSLVGVGINLYFLLVVVSQYQALGLIRMHDEISMK